MEAANPGRDSTGFLPGARARVCVILSVRQLAHNTISMSIFFLFLFPPDTFETHLFFFFVGVCAFSSSLFDSFCCFLVLEQ